MIFKIIIKFNPSKEPKYVIHRALNLGGKTISFAATPPALSQTIQLYNRIHLESEKRAVISDEKGEKQKAYRTYP